MSNFKNEDLINLKDTLQSMNSEYAYQTICKLTDKQVNKYTDLLSKFTEVNSYDKNSDLCPSNINVIKGKALEEIASYLLEISGNIFEVDRNLRTSTNEIDQLIKLKPSGKLLCSINSIDKRYSGFIAECKNHNKKIDVTHIGKFCSLLVTNKVKLGILFSYHGVTGSGWSNGAGLIKKFYLHKEKLDERYCIIDFDINDFNSILNGKNLLQIIEEKMISLQFDTDYAGYLSKHPAET